MQCTCLHKATRAQGGATWEYECYLECLNKLKAYGRNRRLSVARPVARAGNAVARLGFPGLGSAGICKVSRGAAHAGRVRMHPDTAKQGNDLPGKQRYEMPPVVVWSGLGLKPALDTQTKHAHTHVKH